MYTDFKMLCSYTLQPMGKGNTKLVMCNRTVRLQTQKQIHENCTHPDQFLMAITVLCVAAPLH